MKRPLTDKQLSYACEDVQYLRDLYNVLMQKLIQNEKFEYFIDECSSLYEEKDSIEILISRVMKRNDSPHSQAVLNDLMHWREDFAKNKNIPRQWVLTNHQIRAIAIQPVAEIWYQKKVLAEKQFTQYRASFEKIHQKHEELSNEKIQFSAKERTLMDKMTSQLKMRVRDIAQTYQIPSQFLCTNKVLLDIVHKFFLNSEVQLIEGWRGKLLNKKITKVAKNFSTQLK